MTWRVVVRDWEGGLMEVIRGLTREDAEDRAAVAITRDDVGSVDALNEDRLVAKNGNLQVATGNGRYR